MKNPLELVFTIGEAVRAKNHPRRGDFNGHVVGFRCDYGNDFNGEDYCRNYVKVEDESGQVWHCEKNDLTGI